MIFMPTLLVKNVPETLLRELKRLKVELSCKTWAELLEKLVKIRSKDIIVIEEEDLEKTRRAVEEFLKLKSVVTKKWSEGTVLEEFRKARHHEAKNSNVGC